MTFDEWRATAKACSNIDAELNSTECEGLGGVIYASSMFIAWNPSLKQYWTIANRDEFAGKLSECEVWLWDNFARHEFDNAPRAALSSHTALTVAEAIETAIGIVRQRCEETDTASPEGHEARMALQVLEDIQEQRGCEHFDPACRDGLLTTLCDVVIYG